MTARVRLRPRAWVLVPVALVSVGAMLASALGGQAVHAAAVPIGGSGTDTSLPATDSAVTVKGRGRFEAMAFTINQTRNLSNQAISITWTGGVRTVSSGAAAQHDYVQLMQCWGDPDGTIPDNDGPPPEQCQQGAQLPSPPAGIPPGNAATRIISRSDYAGYDPAVGFTDQSRRPPYYAFRPFRSVNGEVVNASVNPDFSGNDGGNFWLNPFYNSVTTNEIYSSRTDRRGQGQELFEVQTGIEASGLGCGQQLQKLADGSTKVPRCWLVLVPRGSPADENVGVPPQQDAVVTSPLSPEAWKNRIAVELEFNPVDSPCAIGQGERRIAGSELALPAVASWQPDLCSTGNGTPYAYSRMTDGLARQQLLNPNSGSPGMVVVSRPIAADRVKADNPLVYAPLTLGGMVIGFNVERKISGSTTPPEEVELATTRVANLNLTPRLVAKLLTQSYRSQLPLDIVPTGEEYDWIRSNPPDLTKDPDFLRFNPEFTLLSYASNKYLGGLALPLGNSDAAYQVWEWVLSDPEANAWLAGTADEGGMKVNPAYRTTADPNRPDLFPFAASIPESFPKSEAACFQREEPTLSGFDAPALCGGDWFPYVDGLVAGARAGRPATLGAKTRLDEQAQAVSSVWAREELPSPGEKAIMVLTDVASAARYGLQVARLSRAGDTGDGRAFVAPDAAGITAGLGAMEPSADDSRVLQPVPGKDAPGAYPLTTLTYAAIAPLALKTDPQARDDYGAFLDYARGPGQHTGVALGDLPPGYVPLPTTLTARTAESAQLVRNMVEAPQPPPTTTVPESTTTTTTEPPTTPAPTTPTSQPTTTTRPRSGSGTTTTTTTRAPTTTTTVAPTTVPASATTIVVTTVPVTTPELDDTDPPGITPATPILALSRNRFAVPGLGAVALGSGLGALEITKRPRRGGTPKPPTPPAGGA